MAVLPLWQRIGLGSVLTIAVALSTAVFLLLCQARQRIQDEQGGAMELADMVVDQAVKNPLAQVPLVLAQLPPPRHVRLFLLPAQQADYARFQGGGFHVGPLGWFRAFIRPAALEHRHDLPDGMRVMVVADADDETAELWGDVQFMGGLLLGVAVALLGLVVWCVRLALAPLRQLQDGLSHLRQGDFAMALPPFSVPELEPLRRDFNALAHFLIQTRDDNHRLIAKLMSIQEDERQSLAHEFHDELGPCLYGIKAQASCIMRDARADKHQDYARAIMDLSQDMQAMNRRIMHRLRPMALDDLGLEVALQQLVQDWCRRAPDIRWSLDCSLPDNLADQRLALGAYRIVQECLTNAARHACPTQVTVTAAFHSGGDDWSGAGVLHLCVQDDGVGLPPSIAGGGFGLRGIRERVRGLNGVCRIAGPPRQGTRIAVVLPLPDAA